MENASIEFKFDYEERLSIIYAALAIKHNPYWEYTRFREEVVDYSRSGEVPTGFSDFIEKSKEKDLRLSPCLTMANCPIDDNLPYPKYNCPIQDKRKDKKTFVSEFFLMLYATLTNQHPIAYANVNEGDVFQDILPWDKMAETQSQKAVGDIYFHKDLANHFVRPDYVNILGLRGAGDNVVYTSFSRNIDILNDLDKDSYNILSREEFYTPFDDLSTFGGKVNLGDAQTHRVIGGRSEYDIRVFENRTIGLSIQAQTALYKLFRLLHKNKNRFMILPGHFLGESNNESLHCKEIVLLNDPEGLRRRWLQKTVNVSDISLHKNYLADKTDYLING